MSDFFSWIRKLNISNKKHVVHLVDNELKCPNNTDVFDNYLNTQAAIVDVLKLSLNVLLGFIPHIKGLAARIVLDALKYN